MKKILYIAILTSVLAGCTKDFDPELLGTLSPSTFPSNEAEFELYTLNLYKSFDAKWGYGGAFSWENNFFSPEWGNVIMFDGPTDIINKFTNWGGFWEGFSTVNFAFMQTQGRGSHFEKVRKVTQATKIIDDIEKSEINENVKLALLGEAKMARGWIMYYLMHIYGSVPVIIDPELIGTDAEKDMNRPTRTQFVTWIESDLKFAAENLPIVAENYGRFTKGSALTVLMRLYLNEKNFAQVIEVGREIEGLGYSLIDEYVDLFKEETEVNGETIWAVSCQNGGNGNFNPLAFYCLPTKYKNSKIKGGWGGDNGVLSMPWEFYDLFESTDTRTNCLIESYYDDDSVLWDRSNLNGAIINKYPAEGGNDNSVQGNDYVVCRYADVLLMLAEAMNEIDGPTSEAIAYLNEIRTRANTSLVSTEESASKEAFRDAVFIERGKEFYLEGLRKMDLIRMDKTSEALSLVGKTAVSPYEVFPIPDYAINNSEGQLIQNDGY